MAEHGFGLSRPNGQATVGLGLAQRAAQRAEAGVTREINTPAPPLPGQVPDILTSGGKIALPGLPAGQARATKSRIPKFSEDPLRSIAFALSEAALAFAGQPTNLARLMRLESEDEANAQAQAIQQQSLKLRKDAMTFQAIKFGADQLKGKSGDEADAVISTIENIVPEAAEVLRAMGKAGAEKSQALLEMFTENPGIFPGASDIAQALGAEKTMELFGPIATALAKQKALAPGEKQAAQDQADREVATALAKQQALAPGASQADKDRAQLEVDTSLRKQKALAPERVAEAGATAAATEAAKAKFREPKGKAVNILLPDGKRASGRELPSGELKIVGEGGTLVSAPPGSLKMTLQAAPGELPDAALNRKVTQTKATMGNFVRMASETITFLRNPKTVLGGAGATIRFAQSLKAQASQLARAFSGDHFDGATSGDLTVAQILDPKRYNFEGLQAISAATTKVKANIIAMAYIIARARDPSGRLSDFDVQVAMDSLGFDSNDKDIIAATISDRVR